MAHPGDGGCFCALFEGDHFGSGDGSASYWDGVLCDAGGHVLCKVLEFCVEGEVVIYCVPEFDFVCFLVAFASGSAGVEFFLVCWVLSLCDELSFEAFYSVGGCPDAF